MCEPCTSLREWFQEPITWSEEAWKIAMVSALAVFILCLGSYCLYNGTAGPNNFIYSYIDFSIASVIIVGTITMYVTKAILHQYRVREDERELEVAEQRSRERAMLLRNIFFPNMNIQELPVCIGMVGGTGWVDQHQYIPQQGPIVRGCTTDGRPFLGLRLRVQNRNNPITVIISTVRGSWVISCSDPRIIPYNNLLQEDSSDTRMVLPWLQRLMNGEECHLLTRPGFNQDLVELNQSPTIALWNNN